MLYIGTELLQLTYSFFRRHNILVGIFGVCVLAYLAGAADPATTTDYPVYSSYYYQAISGNFYFERGYSELGLFCLKRGLSYADFRLIFSIIASVILFFGVRRFTSNLSLFVGLYGCTVFFNDATQIRNFMMIAIVILACSFLITRSVRNVGIAFILILISAQFQSLGYFFLLVPIIELLPERFHRASFYGAFLVVILLTLVLKLVGISNLLAIPIKILSIISSRGNLISKLSSQYNYGVSSTNLMLTVGATLCGFIFELVVINFGRFDDISMRKIHVAYSAVLASFLAVPMLYIAVDYSRIQRNAFLFVLITAALYFEKKEKKDSFGWVVGILLGMTCLVFAVMNYHIWGPLYQQSIPYLAKIFN